MTDDPLVGDDDDKLKLATFSNQRESLGHLSLIFSEQSSSYYQQLVLALQNVDTIQQQLSDEHLFLK